METLEELVNTYGFKPQSASQCNSIRALLEYYEDELIKESFRKEMKMLEYWEFPDDMTEDFNILPDPHEQDRAFFVVDGEHYKVLKTILSSKFSGGGGRKANARYTYYVGEGRQTFEVTGLPESAIPEIVARIQRGEAAASPTAQNTDTTRSSSEYRREAVKFITTMLPQERVPIGVKKTIQVDRDEYLRDEFGELILHPDTGKKIIRKKGRRPYTTIVMSEKPKYVLDEGDMDWIISAITQGTPMQNLEHDPNETPRYTTKANMAMKKKSKAEKIYEFFKKIYVRPKNPNAMIWKNLNFYWGQTGGSSTRKPSKRPDYSANKNIA